ncbi:hypothetical protein ACMD2_23965, partial [Ananas comosus]
RGIFYVKSKGRLMRREAYKKLQDGWLNNGDKVPPAEFAKIKSLLIQSYARRGLMHLRSPSIKSWSRSECLPFGLL